MRTVNGILDRKISVAIRDREKQLIRELGAPQPEEQGTKLVERIIARASSGDTEAVIIKEKRLL